jgi:ABC-type oligopeptide transport system substrate-binding subunit
MKKSPMRLLLLALSVVALALALAPASFAGEDDDGPGPTQAGETQGPVSGSSGPASLQGPASTDSESSESSEATIEVLGASTTKTTKTADVVKAHGGIQAGFGGMAASSGSLPIAGITGVLLILAGALIFVPAHLRQRN